MMGIQYDIHLIGKRIINDLLDSGKPLLPDIESALFIYSCIVIPGDRYSYRVEAHCAT